ncbi:MAG: hypothetical protein LRY72_18300 [Saccharospirillaceae bacterium]|nr:hypothetical protein [Saccharospirillaceae bacterium]
MDEQGRIHNTPKPPSESSKALPQPEAEPQADNFLTEEQFQQTLEKDRSENPPFFTWIDAYGRLQSQEIPQISIEVEEVAKLQAADHALLPPMRVSGHIRDSGCCVRYQNFFKDNIPEYKSVLFSQPHMSVPFKTRSGDKPVWYFRLAEAASAAVSESRILKLHLRNTDGSEGEAPLAVIALNTQWQPLYFIPQVVTQRYLSTWRSSAYRESLISISDADVSAFIVYFPHTVPASATLQVEWAHGKTSD